MCSLQLDTMVNKMHTEDLFGIKARINKWHAWNPSLPMNDRLKCGFMHPQSRWLLCPTDLDWEDTMHINPLFLDV